MAQMNRNAAYLYEVDGLTVWERLRVIRGFLSERQQALALAELGKEEINVKLGKLDNTSFKYRKLVIETSDLDNNIQDAKDEIEFLEELEEKLAAEAELTRVEGKSDREMYELNFFHEKIERNLLQAKAEISSTGHISPDTMKILIREPSSLKRAVDQQLLPPDAMNLAVQPLLIEDKQ